MKVDFIIVGQGLAGSLLAFELLRQNKSFIIFDDPDQRKSSEVAAGLINPVVFRRMNKSWLVDDAFPQMVDTYQQLEYLLKVHLYFPTRMLKRLNEEGVIFWKERVFANQLKAYLEAETDMNFKNQGVSESFSFGCINKSGSIDIQTLILHLSDFINRKHLIRKEKLDYTKLIFQSGFVNYHDVTAEKIIFCEGSAVSQNPFFKNLKFKHSKGEILELKIPGLKLNKIISDEVFVMPVGDNRYKVGATYAWNELNWQTTDSAREELITKLKKIISVPFDVISQNAGIRPTMHDRKPVIGLLPENKQIGIFNGLGSKGILLGPYFARQFTEYLVGNTGYIFHEVDLKRYFKVN